MFFIHGWPDTAHVWDAQFDYFGSRFHCVAPRLPGFEEREKTGLSFHQLEVRLRATIEESLANSHHEQLTLVCHDWGALVGYLLQRPLPDQIERMVTIDVGANFRMENWRQRIGITFYQLWLIKAFFIGKFLPPIGDWLTRIMVLLLKAPPRPITAHSEMNYLYWHFWLELIKTGNFAGIDGQYEPTCPILFLYGEKKPFHLHTEAWIQLVNSHANSQAVGIDSDHWVMVRQPDLTNFAIDEFISKGAPVQLWIRPE